MMHDKNQYTFLCDKHKNVNIDIQILGLLFKSK